MKSLTTAAPISPDTQAPSELPAVNGKKELSAADIAKLRKSLPWPIFVIFIGVTALMLGLYGWSVHSATLLVAEFLVGTAALATGALIGFLFGIPRAPVEANDPAEPVSSIRYRPSNSLEQVSEWLTKILVGAGLVQLLKLRAALASLGAAVASSFIDVPQGAALVSQLVAIVFVVYGFLVSFLWTRIYYSRLQALSDVDTGKALDKALADKQYYESLASGMVSGAIPIAKPPAATEKTLQLEAAETAEWPPPVREKFEKFTSASVNWNEDTTAKVFGVKTSIDNGKVLEAEFEAELRRAVVIRLRVRSIMKTPLDGPVTFCLHPSFSKPVIEVQPTGDRAETKITAAEWFTVVAILDSGNTLLALNLKEMPNAPDWFKLP
jgi:hypothetical protein